MLNKVFETILNHNLIKNGDTVVAAVSGGPDSACLLHVLYLLTERLHFRLFGIHVNHMLRGAESDADAAYTAELCRSLGIPLHTVSCDVGGAAKSIGISLEEAGRYVRYREFDSFADSIGASEIAVGHNKNDQAETVLMHIIRGSGLSGLAGMEYRRGRAIRPLLDIYRSEVEKYCSDNNLSPRIDSTNLTTDFTRNRIRHDLIPFIDRNFGSDFTESLCRLSAIAACDDNYLEAQASVAYAECLEYSGEDFVRLKMARLADLHPALLKRVLRLALQNASGNLKDIGSLHIEKLCRLVPNGGTGTVIQLPGGMRAGISYELLKIYKGREKSVRTVFDSPVSLPGHTVVDGKSAYIDASLEEMPERVDKYEKIRYNSLVQYFDYDCLNKDIRIRNRREGDLFKPFKSTGTKKLKEFFIDGKIPREDRDGIPLLASGREIVWVIGYKISDKFKVTENTKRVLRMEYRRTYDGGN